MEMKKKSRKRRKTRENSIHSGWLIADIDEVNRRHMRGISEPFTINKVDGNSTEPFDSYSVISESKSCSYIAYEAF